MSPRGEKKKLRHQSPYVYVLDLRTKKPEHACADALNSGHTDSSTPNPLDRLRPVVVACGVQPGIVGRERPMRTYDQITSRDFQVVRAHYGNPFPGRTRQNFWGHTSFIAFPHARSVS